jgi:hypothetical protein
MRKEICQWRVWYSIDFIFTKIDHSQSRLCFIDYKTRSIYHLFIILPSSSYIHPFADVNRVIRHENLQSYKFGGMTVKGPTKPR